MSKAMEEAKTALDQLLENARVGNIIPIRLPGQIEEIQALLLQAQEEHQEEIEALKNRPGGEAGEIITENAEFMKTAIHDLKNPLASIKGYADLLNNPSMGGELNEMQDQLLQVIRTNSGRMETLLADMSYINKLRSGILRVNNKMDMFKNIAMLAEKETRPLAEELNRQLVFDIADGLPLLNTDGEHLAQAITKLVENGLRYSPEGSGTVTVYGRSEDGNLLVTIKDNGCGITEADMSHLGELFFRSDNDVVRAYKGSGLGVYIAYALVEALGGTHDVESETGKGTSFYIRMNGVS